MIRRINYRSLATHLSDLPLRTTRADLSAKITSFRWLDADHKNELLAAIEVLPAEAGWIEALLLLASVLKADNPRFIEALFMEWALQDI